MTNATRFIAAVKKRIRDAPDAYACHVDRAKLVNALRVALGALDYYDDGSNFSKRAREAKQKIETILEEK